MFIIKNYDLLVDMKKCVLNTRKIRAYDAKLKKAFGQNCVEYLEPTFFN